MLSNHLQAALKDLNDLVTITQNDIDDIKEAKHDSQFDRVTMKNEKLTSFENKKAMIDYEIAQLMTQNPHKDLGALLTDQEHTDLENMKQGLASLREINTKYAKMVLSVSSFFNTLLERVVPTEMHGYKSVASRNSSFLEVRA
jgi:uncharacterized linocin/CFP29 family protein